MSLAIDVDQVCGVLLADGWHTVTSKSFNLDSYEYVSNPPPPKAGEPWKDCFILLGGGTEELIPATGASWMEPNGETVFCPLTSIVAVRCGAKKRKT